MRESVDKRRLLSLVPAVGKAFALSSVGLAMACGWQTPPFTMPSPAAEPELRQAWLDDPTDPERGVALAAAYLGSGRLGEAEAILETTRAEVQDPTATYLLALTRHRLGRVAEADQLYHAFLDHRPRRLMEEEAHIRIEALRPRVARFRASVRVDQAALRPAVRRDLLVVMPFRPASGGEAEEARAVALSDLVARDLATVLPAVIDPMEARAVADVMGVDPVGSPTLGDAALASVLTGAGAVLQGSIVRDTEGSPRLAATLWQRVDSQTFALADVSVTGGGGDLVTAQKRLSLRVLLSLEGAVAIADAARLSRRLLEGDQALVAYGAGLLASDSADFQDAVAAFDAAAVADTASVLATSSASQARSWLEAESGPLSGAVRTAVRAGQADQTVMEARGRGGVAGAIGGSVGARNTTTEVLGQDRLGVPPIFELTFRLPGGSR